MFMYENSYVCKRKVRRWGVVSFAVTLPKVYCEMLNLTDKSEFTLEMTDKSVITMRLVESNNKKKIGEEENLKVRI